MQVGGLGQRGEDLATRDPEAAVHRHGPGGEAGRLARGPTLAERLCVDVAVLDDAPPHGGPAPVVGDPVLVGHGQVVGDLAGEEHGRRVHVEGQRRGAAVPAQFLRDQGVGHEVGPQPAVLLGDAQGQEPRLAHIGEVLVGE